MKQKQDVIVIGAGHNGLVAAALLARAGLDVLVLEDKDVVGGAAKTERPFARVPGLGHSTGAYLLGVMPPELMALLGLEVPLIRRDPHYFLPTTGHRYLLFGSDQAEMQRQFLSFFSEADWKANQALNAEIAQIRDDIWPTWMQEPLTIEETAEQFVRPALRQAFIDLCRRPVSHYLDRFGFKSDLLRAMYAVTDGFTGLKGSWDTPGTGMNFLAHNMCRLPGSDGTWMIAKGGMGAVSQAIAKVALQAGARIATGRRVSAILSENGVARGVRLADGSELTASVVVANADPFRMRELVGAEKLPAAYNARLDEYRVKDGTSLKVNLALKALPRFKCLPELPPRFAPTIHLLPDESEVIRTLTASFEAVEAGELPEFPAIEWYFHTTIDPSLQDEAGHHSSALFVQWVPYAFEGTTWEAEESRYVEHLLAICDRFAPGTSDLVADTFTLTPPKIERHFGITGGHIQHIDNSWGFADRLPYRTPVAGLYSASAGTHPGGAVIGCAGHNAARRVLADLGKPAARV